MNLNSAVPISRRGTKGKGALLSLLLVAALVAVFVPFFGNLATADAATGASPFDNVQVNIQTSSALPNYYLLSAYNTTGGLVASYQSQYPAASFELPGGAYIFAATATQQQNGYYPYPVGLYGGAATASATGAAPLPPVKCCVYQQPSVEYGYVSQQVSGPTSLTISTKMVNQTSSSTLTIKVNYPNGTAASGVYVSASVLGDNYGWAYGANGVSMSDTTDSQGAVTLVAPTAPVIVSASAYIPILLPYNQTTIQVTVAGEKVNVTANWQPNYVSFTGQALILPPQTSASIALKYQPQSYGPIGYSTGQNSPGATALGVTATGGSGSSVLPAQSTAQQQVTILQQAPAAQSAASSTEIFLISGLAAAISVAALSVAVLVARARPKQKTQ